MISSLPSLLLLLPVAVLPQDSAPSSHLVYTDASFPGDILIHEVRVPKAGEALFTYYEALGWSGSAAGYAGIQTHPDGHNYIFSIWDHADHSAPIQAVHLGPGTVTEPFGGEGTGLKSWNFELGWDTDVWYTLVVRCWPVGDHTFYGYWVLSDKTHHWTHLVTMDVATPTPNAYLQGGNDSFIEDWLSTGARPRTTHLRHGWKHRLTGEWHPFATARYSVNSWDLTEGKRSFHYRTSWDAGVSTDATGDFYYMTSGGSATLPTTENPSTHTLPRTDRSPPYEPLQIASTWATAADHRAPGDERKRRQKITWELSPSSAPQFAYEITATLGPAEDRRTIDLLEKIDPDARTAEVELPAEVATDASPMTLQLQCRDLFDRVSEPATIRFR